MESIKVRLIDGSFHSVDSDALAFQIAAGIAFREACKKAKATLLEPIMRFEIVTPNEYIGDVTQDLNKRRGQVEEVQSRITDQVILGKVPLCRDVRVCYNTAQHYFREGRPACWSFPIMAQSRRRSWMKFYIKSGDTFLYINNIKIILVKAPTGV